MLFKLVMIGSGFGGIAVGAYIIIDAIIVRNNYLLVVSAMRVITTGIILGLPILVLGISLLVICFYYREKA